MTGRPGDGAAEDGDLRVAQLEARRGGLGRALRHAALHPQHRDHERRSHHGGHRQEDRARGRRQVVLDHPEDVLELRGVRLPLGGPLSKLAAMRAAWACGMPSATSELVTALRVWSIRKVPSTARPRLDAK